MSGPEPSEPAPEACAQCLARTWLLGRLSGHLDVARARILELLDLADEELIAAVAGADAPDIAAELAAFEPDGARRRCAAAGVEAICGCHPAYPERLWSLSAEPAVLHVAGGMDRFLTMAADDAVAVVGARTASPYGLDMARGLARGLAAAGLVVVSGMAIGIDSAAHEGALEGGGPTIAVLAAAPDHAYPASRRALHRRILTAGAVVSELGPGIPARRWMFPARNRIIAALSQMTVVVAARIGSGAMLTAQAAMHLRRLVGAVPGPATAPLSAGPHALLRADARVITDAGDVMTALWGGAPTLEYRSVPGPMQPLFHAIADGFDLLDAFAVAGLDERAGLTALADLELGGFVRRGLGGRYAVVP
ncbi:MAG TPA: DNA-processing protein DprA [Solirubrobacteraceae bacterium]|nr:DNA-processing protein DprA [Solirubrobacteraceae bacterium]